jgi:hypothetical protein
MSSPSDNYWPEPCSYCAADGKIPSYFRSDPFYWEDNWKPASPKRVQQQLLKVVEQQAWVLDGNFDDHKN